MSSDPKVHSFQDVAKHNHKDDCWLIISGKVYNVTSFLDDHPGGDDVLIQATAKDATDEFEDIGHSENARDMLKDYYVGEIDVSTIPAKKVPTKPQSQPSKATTQPSQSSESSGFLIKLLQFLLPLIVIGLAFALKNYKKESTD
ncbi:cytochrome b5-like [Amaranthus tricolor]|uniref:cytochrome b5-like n=1 Tax=Amaranthus tricolor TaxID=29722 RepID=UPI0025910DBF|nr:cytochrome b5-like [Amaranthus tricolor]XP_057531404.1 cytochrome b5-like [Amaranthus tricolor]XP_057531405.1 cytochrome b5-like [Amaranthus tricolor]